MMPPSSSAPPMPGRPVAPPAPGGGADMDADMEAKPDTDSPAMASAEGHDFAPPDPSEPLKVKNVTQLDAELRALLSTVLDTDVREIAGPIEQGEKGAIPGALPAKLAVLALTMHEIIARVGGPKWERRLGPTTPEDLRTNTGIHALASAFRLAAKDKELVTKIRPALMQIAQQSGGKPGAAAPPPPEAAAGPSRTMAGRGPGAPMPAPPNPQIMRAAGRRPPVM